MHIEERYEQTERKIKAKGERDGERVSDKADREGRTQQKKR